MKLFISIFFIFTSTLSYAQWIWCHPSPSSYTNSDIHFVNDTIGFIISPSAGLIRTNNCGNTWNVFEKNIHGNDIDFHGHFGVVAGTNGDIYFSDDSGDSWRTLKGVSHSPLSQVQIISQDEVIIVEDNGLALMTNDHGISWDTLIIDELQIDRVWFFSYNTGIAVCGSKLLKTDNRGLSWRTVESVNYFPAGFFTLYFVNESIGFASRAHDDLLKTTDGGETWTEYDGYLDAAYSIFFVNSNLGFIAGEYGAVHKTTDCGKTWEWAGYDTRIGGNNLLAIYFINEQTGFSTGFGGRILKTTNGGESWTEYASSYNNVIDLNITPDSTIYALTTNSVIKSTDYGESWKKLDLKTSTWFNTFYFFNNDTGLVGGKAPNLCKTVDGGEEWKPIDCNDYNQAVTSLCFVNNKIGYLCGSMDGLMKFFTKTTDGGVTWNSVPGETKVFEDLLFIDENTGFGISYGALYRTINGGFTWTMIQDPYGDFNQFYKLDNEVIYVAGEFNLILKTSDGGNTWLEILTPYDHLNSVCFYDEMNGFAAGEYGNFFITRDGGQNWITENAPITINKMIISETGMLFAAGSKGSVVKRQMQLVPTASRIIHESNVLVYPNPAQNLLNFDFTEPVHHAHYHITDLWGRTMLSGTTSDPEPSINITGITPGIYILNLSYNGITHQQKIVIK